MIREGKKVDYVFGDLTDIPVSTSPQGEIWDFIRLILNKSMQVLKSSGKYMTHVSCVDSSSLKYLFTIILLLGVLIGQQAYLKNKAQRKNNTL